MNAGTTITIRLPAELKEKLGRLAHDTRRSRSYLATEAVTAYVDRELSIIDGIQQGLADVEAGRVTAHRDVIAELHGIIDSAERKRAAQG